MLWFQLERLYSKYVREQSRFVSGNAHQGSAFFDIRVHSFVSKWNEYNPSVLDFQLSKFLEIVLKIHAQHSTNFF